MTNNVQVPHKKARLPIALALALGVTNALTGCGAEQLGSTNDSSLDGRTANITTNSLLLLGGLAGVAAIVDSGSSDTGIVVTTAGNTAVAGDSQTNNGTGNNNGSGSANDGGTTSNDGTGNNGSTTANDGNNNDGSNNNNDGGNSSGSTGNDNGSSDNGSTGNDSNNGSTGTASGSGNDNSNSNGSSTDGGSDIDDDSSSDGDNTATDSSGNDAVLVDFLEPPTWLRGMWGGTDAKGVRRVGFASPTEMGTGTVGQPLSSYSDIPEVCFHLIESSDSVFKYTIWYPLADGTEVAFDEQWVNNGDGTLLYTVSGAMENELTMHKTPASNFFTPPQWLQGRWESSQKVAQINEGNIIYGDIAGTRLDYYQLASHAGSVFQLQKNNGNIYSYKLTTVDAQGKANNINDTYQSTGTNTLTYTGSAENNNAIEMTRQ